MLYVFIGYDKPDALHIRQETRPTHLDFLSSLGDHLKAAGPHLDPVSGDPVGSIIIVEGTSQAHVAELMARDPYAQAGLFARSDVFPYKLNFGTFAGQS